MAFITRKIGLNEYLALLPSFTPVSIYHGEGWLRAIRDGLHADVFGLFTATEAGAMVAITPIMGLRKGLFRCAGSPLRGMYTEYGGPLFIDDTVAHRKREVLKSQHEFLKRSGAAYIEWGGRSGEGSEYMNILEEIGCDYCPRRTMVIDTGSGADAVWKGFQSRARNMVRKAERNGVEVKVISPDADDVQRYYDMLRATFRRQGKRPPHPKSFFDRVCTSLKENDQLWFVAAEKDRCMLAAALFLRDGERMMYFSGTATEEGFRLAASSVIQWYAIRKGIEEGMTEYDLGGTGNNAIDRFKMSFGGRAECHGRWVYRTRPARVAENVYQRLVGRGWARVHG